MKSLLSTVGRAWHANARYREMLTIVVLLVATLIFGFVLIPLGINEGFGNIGPGLSPRFMPELATAGILIALVFGLARYLFTSGMEQDDGFPRNHEGAHPFRAVAAMLICLFFAATGFRIIGFYLGGMIMSMLLTLLLGERKLFGVVVVPILILAAIYLIFEIGFQIRLPKLNLIPGVPI